MKDLEVVEGEDVEMCPVISSSKIFKFLFQKDNILSLDTDYTVVWHGPAVDSKRARIQVMMNPKSEFKRLIFQDKSDEQSTFNQKSEEM